MTGVTNVFERIAWLEWNWAGHITRMNDGRWTKKIESGEHELTKEVEANHLQHSGTTSRELLPTGCRELKTNTT